MNGLKVLFVGVGSIAKRHIRNLHMIAEKRELPVTIDAFRRTSSIVPEDGVNKEYTELSDVPCDYDVVFITNLTSKHLETLEQFHEKGRNFFIEKPVVSLAQVEVAKEFELRPDSIYYIACPLRYNAVIQYIKDNVPADEVISIRSISSSYLPDWRKGQDYRQTYSAHKDMGGGVSIDLIHEWDYLTYLFGWPERVFSLIGRKSSLEIDSDDYAVYIAEYADKVMELHLDYFGRETIREIELFTKEDTVLGDVANNRITFLKSGRVVDFHEDRDDYQRREMEHFLDMVEGKATTGNGYWNALDVLELTRGRKCMDRLVINREVCSTVVRQLENYWPETDRQVVEDAIPIALQAIREGFTGMADKRFFKDGDIVFSPYFSVHWMIFLYRLSHAIFERCGGKEADQVYYLNKIMHSNDWFYAIDLPVHFCCEHPVGSVLGRANYGDYFFIYQGTTVGGNRSRGILSYPTIGENVILFANATILGDSHIGNNVVVSAGTYIINEKIPDNCIVFGRSPNLVIKRKSEVEIKKYTQHIWGWRIGE